MELDDLKNAPTAIRTNLQITGPAGTLADPVTLSVQSRVVTPTSDSTHTETIKSFDNAVVRARASIGGLQGTTQKIVVSSDGLANCYWLPWGEGRVYRGQLGRDHEFFFTYTINGCGVIISGTDTQPEVAHANLDSARLTAAAVEGARRLDGKSSAALRKQVGKEVARNQALTYEQFYGSLAAKLIDDGEVTGPRVEVVTPDQYLIRADAGFGAIFGVQGVGGKWTFYGNWGGQTRQVWP